jgi:hypothetical protein
MGGAVVALAFYTCFAACAILIDSRFRTARLAAAVPGQYCGFAGSAIATLAQVMVFDRIFRLQAGLVCAWPAPEDMPAG